MGALTSQDYRSKLDYVEPVLHVAAFEDNYIWLVRGRDPASVAIIDPGDEDPVLQRIEQDGLVPAAILCTHRHWDHTDGAQVLRDRYQIPVYGPAREAIAAVTNPLGQGDAVSLDACGLKFTVLDTPGHTRGHISYSGHGMLFCGDTLFSAGCGRLFDGTAEQLYSSLMQIAGLPGETRIYCAHEYTAANLRFAATVEPANDSIRERMQQVAQVRKRNLPSLPVSLARELQYNPFLRCHLATIRQAAEQHAGRRLGTELEVFTELRRWKDGFR